ncbi:hypothetical protein BJX76DRAFT_342843 [Aspergillus varians]
MTRRQVLRYRVIVSSRLRGEQAEISRKRCEASSAAALSILGIRSELNNKILRPVRAGCPAPTHVAFEHRCPATWYIVGVCLLPPCYAFPLKGVGKGHQ